MMNLVILYNKASINEICRMKNCAESQDSPLNDMINTYLCRPGLFLEFLYSLNDMINAYLCRLWICGVVSSLYKYDKCLLL